MHAKDYRYADVSLREVPEPPRDCPLAPVPLTDETMTSRRRTVLGAMAERGLDALVVYADLEHGSSFEYLVGFLPRFEEALLVCDVEPTRQMEKFLFATDQFYGIRSENERALKLKEFWTLLFELIGSVYYRWGAPEEAEKFFYGNARRLRSQIGGGGLNGKEESNV